MRTRLKPFSISRSRRLRRDATEAEKNLWWKLREMKQSGYHFRRQVPFRSYILDFVEHNYRLVIELDGGQHAQGVHRLRDARRDKTLRENGYQVLRFWNSDIAENVEGVADTILNCLKQRPPTRNAARPDLPTGGR